jgi:hypothetical protein
MTIENTYSPYISSGNGTTTIFSSSSWGVLSKLHLIVNLVDKNTGAVFPQVEGTHYTMLNFDLTLWEIQFNSAPSSIYNVVVTRNIPITQSLAYQTTKGYQGENIEQSFDKLTQIAQDLAEGVDRSIKIDVGNNVLTTINTDDLKGKILGFNSTTGEMQGVENDFSATSVVATNSLTSRLLADRFADIANVSDYGAIGDNITDDLNAINLALAENKIVFFPSKTYFVSQMPNFAGHTIICDETTIEIGDIKQTLNSQSFIKSASNLIIKGRNTHSTTITNIVSVSGSVGNYSVVANVVDASNISVGDTILVRDVIPGIKMPGLLNSVVPSGQFDIGFFKMASATLTSSGTTCTITAPSTATIDISRLVQGNLIIAKGETREITSIPSMVNAYTYTFDIDSAFSRNITLALQYWYVAHKDTGSVEVSGTGVIGTGTSFTTDVNVGDNIIFAGKGMAKVVSITDNTNLTIDRSLTISAGNSYGTIVFGETHEGCWQVSNVAGNQITWVNKNRIANAIPPVNKVSFGNITTLKTILTYNNNAGGLKVHNGQVYLRDISLIGNANTSSIGIDAKDVGTSANIILNNKVAISNFGWNIWAENNSFIYGLGSFICGATTRGVNLNNGAGGNFSSSTISGNVGIGILLGVGCRARMSDTRVLANSSHGLRMEVGSSIWSDFSYYEKNGASGALVVGGVLVHFVGSRFFNNISNGITGQNGIFGRGSGAIFLCNGSACNITNGHIEMNQANAISNTTDGFVISRSTSSLEEMGSSYHSSRGIVNVDLNQMTIDNSIIIGNNIGISCSDKGVVRGSSAGVFNSTLTDCIITNNGEILLNNSSPINSVNQTLNYINTTDGGVISDGTNTIKHRFLTGTLAHNFGNITSGETASTTMTLTGVSVSNLNVVSVGTNLVNTNGLVLSAKISNTDEITISASNITGSTINVLNQTYRVLVQQLLI